MNVNRFYIPSFEYDKKSAICNFVTHIPPKRIDSSPGLKAWGFLFNKIHEDFLQQPMYKRMAIPIQEDPYAEIINSINTGIITINIGLILIAWILQYKDERLPTFQELGAATIGCACYNKYLFPIGMMVTCLNLGCTYGLIQQQKNYRDGDLYLLRKQLFTFPTLTAPEKDPLGNNDKIIHHPHVDENMNETLRISEEEKQSLGSLESMQEETLKTPCKDIYEATEKSINIYNAMSYKEKSAWRRKNNWPNKN